MLDIVFFLLLLAVLAWYQYLKPALKHSDRHGEVRIHGPASLLREKLLSSAIADNGGGEQRRAKGGHGRHSAGLSRPWLKGNSAVMHAQSRLWHMRKRLLSAQQVQYRCDTTVWAAAMAQRELVQGSWSDCRFGVADRRCQSWNRPRPISKVIEVRSEFASFVLTSVASDCLECRVYSVLNTAQGEEGSMRGAIECCIYAAAAPPCCSHCGAHAY